MYGEYVLARWEVEIMYKSIIWRIYVCIIRTYYRVKNIIEHIRKLNKPVEIKRYWWPVSFRQKLEDWETGRLSDLQWKEICRIATNDIKGNKLWLRQRTEHVYVLVIMNTAYVMLEKHGYGGIAHA